MAYTETKTTSYGSRLGNSFKAIFTGFILFIGATILLWWNEGRAVEQTKNIEATQDACQHVDDVSKVDGALESQVIHATADSKTSDILTDKDFNVKVNAIRLSRKVEFFQYVEESHTETKDKVGGSQEETTTYTYKTDWTSRPEDSQKFKDPEYKNVNRTYLVYEDDEFVAENVTFGGYKLSGSLISSITGSTNTDIEIDEAILADINNKMAQYKGNATVSTVPANNVAATATNDTIANDSTAAPVKVKAELPYVHVTDNVIYIGRNPGTPEIGDVRITFTQVNPGQLSIIAKVQNGELVKSTNKHGSFSMVERGNHSMEEMFQAAEDTNTMWTWVLRIVGILLVISGLKSMFGFFITVLKVLPFLSDIANVGANIVCGLIGIVWSFLIISIAWLFYRPLIAIPLLLVVVGGIVFLVMRSKKSKAAAAAEAPAESK